MEAGRPESFLQDQSAHGRRPDGNSAGMLVCSCRFVMGSTKMLAVALGKSESDELRTNLSRLSARLKGQVGHTGAGQSRSTTGVRGCSFLHHHPPPPPHFPPHFFFLTQFVTSYTLTLSLSLSPSLSHTPGGPVLHQAGAGGGGGRVQWLLPRGLRQGWQQGHARLQPHGAHLNRIVRLRGRARV